jgi:hypothetical protein
MNCRKNLFFHTALPLSLSPLSAVPITAEPSLSLFPSLPPFSVPSLSNAAVQRPNVWKAATLTADLPVLFKRAVKITQLSVRPSFFKSLSSLLLLLLFLLLSLSHFLFSLRNRKSVCARKREWEREKESCLLARKFAFFPLPWKWMVHRPKEKERNPTRLQGRPKKRRNCFQPWIYACARAHACVHLEKGESERERERESK